MIIKNLAGLRLQNKDILVVAKNEQQIPVKGHTYEFLPITLSKFMAFGMLHSPKHNVLLKVLALKKVILFSKRALHVGTTRCKWPKYALPGKSSYATVGLLGYSPKSYFVIA